MRRPDGCSSAARSCLTDSWILALVARADYVVDLGPGAGSAGGRVVAAGTVRHVVDTHEQTGSETGRYLAYAADLSACNGSV